MRGERDSDSAITGKTWDAYFMEMALLVASKSKDRSTKVGAVIVGPDNEIRSTGYNSFPRGINDDVEERHVRPEKYLWTEHAERNAIYNAARAGIPTKGCRMYTNTSSTLAGVCMDCARAAVQAGITEVVHQPPGHNTRWGDECQKAHELFAEAGVRFRIV